MDFGKYRAKNKHNKIKQAAPFVSSNAEINTIIITNHNIHISRPMKIDQNPILNFLSPKQ